VYCTGISYTDIGYTHGIHGINKRGNARITTLGRVRVPIVAVKNIITYSDCMFLKSLSIQSACTVLCCHLWPALFGH
jgi:hypothetical protein